MALYLTIKSWRAYWRRTPRERRLIWEAYWRLQLTFLGLKRLGYQKVIILQSQSQTPTDVPSNQPPQMAEEYFRTAIRQISETVNIAASHSILPTTCLSRSIVLCGMLRKRNLPANLQIGVRAEAGHIQAHAWVESLGAVINDLQDVSIRFLPFDQTVCLKESFFQ
jgi:hypothetical protein